MRPHEETREKFLAAIAEQLNPDTIVEAHMFSPLKQGEPSPTAKVPIKVVYFFN